MQFVPACAVHGMHILPDTPQFWFEVPWLQTPSGVQHPLQFVLLQIPPSTGPPSALGVAIAPPSPPDELPPDDDPPPGVGPLPPVVSMGGRDGALEEHAAATPAQMRRAPVMQAATFMP
jgi:hypothetical protein